MKSAWKYSPWYLFLPLFCFSQRIYTNQSALASGDWFKLALTQPGVYKIDLPFLQKLGLKGNSFPSSAVRLFGNGGGMLPEACSGSVTDDLSENSILMVDGGDGLFNGNDYFLFFAEGPHHWVKDSVNKRFTHQKNLFSEKSFYFLSINGNGKRINQSQSPPNFNTTVSSYDERYFYELDTINFLGSGKQWYGDEFSSEPGNQTSRSFATGINSFISNSPISLRANCVARSVGASSRFNLRVNNQQVLQLDVPATTVTATDPFAKENNGSGTATVPNGLATVQIDFIPGISNAQGWIDWFEFFCRRDLSMTGIRQLLFRDWNSVGTGIIGQFTIKNASNSEVWDVTNPLVPVMMQTNVNGSDIVFSNDCSRLREYVCFKPDSAFTPQAIGRIDNQNLHQLQPADFIIVAAKQLQAEANRLAAYHLQRENLHAIVITTDQIDNEFSSGTPDPTAIRDFVKMLYDRAGTDTIRRPKYLLLFGDASFDYKDRITGNTNLVPAYESVNSLDPLNTYTSDDFFGFLSDSSDINNNAINNLLSIGIGRLPAKNSAEAKSYVDKVISYNSSASLGAWRNQMTFVADDEDFNLH
jgi:hypothetical protein